MKITIVILSLIITMALLGMAYMQLVTFSNINHEIEQIEQERDSLLLRTEFLQHKADSLRHLADTVFVEFQQKLVESSRRLSILGLEADSLAREITTLIPPGALRDTISIIVEQLEENHRAQIHQLTGTLTLAQRTIELQRQRLQMADTMFISLKSAYSLLEQERDYWHKQANPSAWTRLMRNRNLILGTSALITLPIVLLVR